MACGFHTLSISRSLLHSTNQVQQHEKNQNPAIDYRARAQWLRAAVLGANDGLVSVASLMIGVGAVNQTAKAMVVSGLAGLVAGTCSMAIGEFVSVYTQYDIEIEARNKGRSESLGDVEEESLPSPLQAASASALAFAFGALLPLLAGRFIRSWGLRVGAVGAASMIRIADHLTSSFDLWRPAAAGCVRSVFLWWRRQFGYSISTDLVRAIMNCSSLSTPWRR